MRDGRLAAIGLALVIVVAGACGGDSTPVEASGPTVPSTGGPTSTGAPGTVPDPTTTTPPAEPKPTRPPATAPPATAPPETAPPATDPPPQLRTVPLGQDFRIDVGESVGVAGADLTVTYGAVLTDSRCPIGVQCIWAGNATISVALAKPGSPPATVGLNTTEGPTSAPYSGYTVALVQLSRGSSPGATLRVT